MKLFRKTICVAFISLASSSNAWAQNDAVDQVARHFAGFTTLTANFRQTAVNGKVTTGTMKLSRPGKARFDYGKSAPMLIVANGSTISLVDYKVSQVQVWPIRETPLSVLLDPKIDLRRFLTAGPRVPGYVTVSAMDPKRPQFGTIDLFFVPDVNAPADLRLAAWRVLDVQGNLTRVELSNLRFNQPISTNAFRFRDPRVGVRAAAGRGR
jgi:outer membrane lipoprotein-sorting protein